MNPYKETVSDLRDRLSNIDWSWTSQATVISLIVLSSILVGIRLNHSLPVRKSVENPPRQVPTEITEGIRGSAITLNKVLSYFFKYESPSRQVLSK